MRSHHFRYLTTARADLQLAELRSRCAQAENDALHSKQHAENVVAKAEAQMRLVKENILKEFEKAVAQREIEITDSAKVRAGSGQLFSIIVPNVLPRMLSLRFGLQAAQRQTEAVLAKTMHRSNKERSALRKQLALAEHERLELELQLATLFEE